MEMKEKECVTMADVFLVLIFNIVMIIRHKRKIVYYMNWEDGSPDWDSWLLVLINVEKYGL